MKKGSKVKTLKKKEKGDKGTGQLDDGSKVIVLIVNYFICFQTILKINTRKMLAGRRLITWKCGETIRNFMMKKVSLALVTIVD